MLLKRAKRTRPRAVHCEGKIPKRTLTKLLTSCRHQCCICHEKAVIVHHIIPVKEGGTNTFDNLIPLCLNCHDRTHSTRKLTRNITPSQLMVYRETWIKQCANDKGRPEDEPNSTRGGMSLVIERFFNVPTGKALTFSIYNGLLSAVTVYDIVVRISACGMTPFLAFAVPRTKLRLDFTQVAKGDRCSFSFLGQSDTGSVWDFEFGAEYSVFGKSRSSILQPGDGESFLLDLVFADCHALFHVAVLYYDVAWPKEKHSIATKEFFICNGDSIQHEQEALAFACQLQKTIEKATNKEDKG